MSADTTAVPVLTIEELTTFLREAFPGTPIDEQFQILNLSAGRLDMTLTSSMRQLRPGDVIGGPTQMALADAAMYALVLGHIGKLAMAVTTSLTMHFLRPARQGALFAVATMLKLGTRAATGNVFLWTDDRSTPCAHAVVAYALPPRTFK